MRLAEDRAGDAADVVAHAGEGGPLFRRDGGDDGDGRLPPGQPVEDLQVEAAGPEVAVEVVQPEDGAVLAERQGEPAEVVQDPAVRAVRARDDQPGSGQGAQERLVQGPRLAGLGLPGQQDEARPEQGLVEEAVLRAAGHVGRGPGPVAVLGAGDPDVVRIHPVDAGDLPVLGQREPQQALQPLPDLSCRGVAYVRAQSGPVADQCLDPDRVRRAAVDLGHGVPGDQHADDALAVHVPDRRAREALFQCPAGVGARLDLEPLAAGVADDLAPYGYPPAGVLPRVAVGAEPVVPGAGVRGPQRGGNRFRGWR
ncbi:hypothetical protein Slala03_61480 [Streptomyces lavendulae subsp. lavendulae]|nr:hypothetical protein Slala03_61480 [Streptomyces lavendulae subsp. lavendulae]